MNGLFTYDEKTEIMLNYENNRRSLLLTAMSGDEKHYNKLKKKLEDLYGEKYACFATVQLRLQGKK
jgi:hypothetical protein